MNRANFGLKNIKKYTYVCSLHFPEGSNLKYWENGDLTPAPANYQGFEIPAPPQTSRNTPNNTFNGKRKLVVNQGISVPDHSKRNYFLLLLIRDICLVTKLFWWVNIFCVRPKIYSHIVQVTNILRKTKRWFAFTKIGFCDGTKGFEEALNAVKFLGWLKKFGPAQNILGPVKGQDICHF